jgi:transcriptional antiterminator NusG
MGRRPTPLDEKEVENVRYQMGLNDVKPQAAQVSFKEGQQVKITEGPFSDFTGIVDKVSDDKEKLSVLVHIFGRETAVELGFNQVEEI